MKDSNNIIHLGHRLPSLIDLYASDQSILPWNIIFLENNTLNIHGGGWVDLRLLAVSILMAMSGHPVYK